MFDEVISFVELREFASVWDHLNKCQIVVNQWFGIFNSRHIPDKGLFLLTSELNFTFDENNQAMKRILLFTFISFSIFTFSQVPNYVPTDNLSAWYPFTGNPNDYSINTLNATNSGANLTTDRLGNLNSAFSFSGSSSSYIYKAHPNNELLDLGQSSFSISVWFKTSTVGFQSILHKRRMGGTSGLSNYEGYDLYLDNGKVTFVIEDINSNASTTVGIVNYSNNAWNNIVAIRDVVTDELRIYVNGQLEASSIDNSLNVVTTTTDLFIGNWPAYPTYSFNGSIDDIGIWKRVLTACEIQNIYNAQVNSIQSSISVNGITLTADLMGASYQWLDCDNGNSVINGAINQSYSPVESIGNYSVQTSLNGCIDTSDCFYLDYSGIDNLDLNNQKSIIKITDLTGREIPFQKNTPLIYYFNDGTMKRVFEIDN